MDMDEKHLVQQLISLSQLDGDYRVCIIPIVLENKQRKTCNLL
jgi:hypothetical protein